MNRLPTFEDVSPLKELLYECHDAAIIDTRQHFNESKHRYDVPGFFAVHVRSKLQDLLASECSNYKFAIDTSGGSFMIAYKDFLIKLYKAYNGMIPVPSKEHKTRLQFMNHNSKVLSWPQRLPGFEEGVQDGAKIHLIAYYDLNSKYELAWLKIACPQSVTTSGIICLWDEIVENPLVKSQPQENLTTERPDLHIALLKDVVIENEEYLEEDTDEASGLS